MPTARCTQTTRSNRMIEMTAITLYMGLGSFLTTKSITVPATRRSIPIVTKSLSFQLKPCPSTPVPIVSCSINGISSISPVPIATRIMLSFCIKLMRLQTALCCPPSTFAYRLFVPLQVFLPLPA